MPLLRVDEIEDRQMALQVPVLKNFFFVTGKEAKRGKGFYVSSEAGTFQALPQNQALGLKFKC